MSATFVELLTALAFPGHAIRRRALLTSTAVIAGVLVLGIVRGSALEAWFAYHAFRDQVRLRTRSPYQEIVITRGRSKPPDARRHRRKTTRRRRSRTFGPASTQAVKETAYLPRRWKDDIRLYLNGNLQFSSLDEYRYHEALVHVGMGRDPQPRRVLILGGGDGLALREVVKYKEVTHIELVDLDLHITRLEIQICDMPLLLQVGEQVMQGTKT